MDDVRGRSKVQISPDTITSNKKKIRVMVYVQVLFCEVYSTLNGNFHYKMFVVFLSTRWEFVSDEFVTYSQKRSKRITDKNFLNVIRDKPLSKFSIVFIQRETIST